MDYKQNKHEIQEMIFLMRRREDLMSLEEHIVLSYMLQKRLENMTPEKVINFFKLKVELDKQIIEYI